jgi:hypothetical protein
MKAQELGLAREVRTREQYIEAATRRIRYSRHLADIAVDESAERGL